MRHSRMKRLLSFMMAVVMVLTLGMNGVYATEQENTGITFEKLDPSEVSANLIRPGASLENEKNPLYAETESVRVIIVLEDSPAVSQFSGRDIF